MRCLKRTKSERELQKIGCRQNSPGASEERATEISRAQTPPLGILILLRPKNTVVDMLSKPVTPGIINQKLSVASLRTETIGAVLR